jgi:hypothetical protein
MRADAKYRASAARAPALATTRALLRTWVEVELSAACMGSDEFLHHELAENLT